MSNRTHGRHPCPDNNGDHCPVCERAVDAYEADQTSYDNGPADMEADRYEREVLGL